jgi:rhodanese-related sulfurtransferase
MTDVINGKYDDVIGSYLIIDSRYSYEYEGGHIQGASFGGFLSFSLAIEI